MAGTRSERAVQPQPIVCFLRGAGSEANAHLHRGQDVTTVEDWPMSSAGAFEAPWPAPSLHRGRLLDACAAGEWRHGRCRHGPAVLDEQATHRCP